MANKPEGVVPSDVSVKILANIIADAYNKVNSTLISGDYATVSKRKAILKQLDEFVQQADKSVQDWVKVEIPTFYEMGMYQANSDLFERGVQVNIKPSLAKFHEEAIVSLSQDAYSNIASGLEGITKTGKRFVEMGTRQALVSKIAMGQITGDTRKDISKAIKQELQESGITSFIDRGGKGWSLDAYTSMLARTKLTQAHNSGLTNRMLESGYDLVMVSSHFGACELCRPYEGKILSISGRNDAFPSMDDAQANGLFHPNCRHTFAPIENPYIEESVIWDANQQQYVPFKEFKASKVDINTTYTKAVLKSDIPTNRAKTVFRAVDSTNKDATLGAGKYFAFEKDSVERYGKNIKEFYLDPNAKMLELPTLQKISDFEDEVRSKYQERTMELMKIHGTEKGFPLAVSEYAKKLGYDGIISDDKVFGSVVFDPSKLIDKSKAPSQIKELLTSNDLKKYEVAFNNNNLRVLEQLRDKYPTDSRFKVHLNYADITGAEVKQTFKDIVAKHKDSLDVLGMNGLSDFNKLLENGTKKEIQDFIQKLPKTSNFVTEMTNIASFL